jgi:hypothetical protein
MAKPDNHYEAAFQAWLRAIRLPFVAVNEARRAEYLSRSHRLAQSPGAAQSLKSVDFIVSAGAATESWLVDIKGRQFPTARRQFWRNWSTADELASLANWEALLGASFSGLLVFAYQVVGDRAPLAAEELFVHRGRLYGFVGVKLAHYASLARPLSKRWNTVTVSIPQFRALARPAREIFGVPMAVSSSGFRVQSSELRSTLQIGTLNSEP